MKGTKGRKDPGGDNLKPFVIKQAKERVPIFSTLFPPFDCNFFLQCENQKWNL